MPKRCPDPPPRQRFGIGSVDRLAALPLDDRYRTHPKELRHDPVAFSQIARSWQRARRRQLRRGKRRFRTRRRRNLPAASQRRRRGALPQPVPEVRSLPVGVPQGCVRTGTLEDGLLNWRTPVMDFHRGLCDFCGRCEQTCPTGAIRDVDAKANRIGLAVIDPQRCIAWISGSCRVCVDACPYEALSADASGRPIVDSTRCNGCGICEYRCPSNTYRSFAGGTQRGINVERSA